MWDMVKYEIYVTASLHDTLHLSQINSKYLIVITPSEILQIKAACPYSIKVSITDWFRNLGEYSSYFLQ